MEDTDMRDGDRAGTRKKGRGFRQDRGEEDDRFHSSQFESLEQERGSGPAKSVEGWVVFVTNVHEEASEDDVYEAFAEFGDIKALTLNLDRRTGYVKGYALVEYADKHEAQAAIDALNGAEFKTLMINVSWAFLRGPAGRARGERR